MEGFAHVLRGDGGEVLGLVQDGENAEAIIEKICDGVKAEQERMGFVPGVSVETVQLARYKTWGAAVKEFGRSGTI